MTTSSSCNLGVAITKSDTVNFDGTGLRRLTDAPGYDAEGSY